MEGFGHSLQPHRVDAAARQTHKKADGRHMMTGTKSIGRVVPELFGCYFGAGTVLQGTGIEPSKGLPTLMRLGRLVKTRLVDEISGSTRQRERARD
jgi:hypothetical protein